MAKKDKTKKGKKKAKAPEYTLEELKTLAEELNDDDIVGIDPPIDTEIEDVNELAEEIKEKADGEIFATDELSADSFRLLDLIGVSVADSPPDEDEEEDDSDEEEDDSDEEEDDSDDSDEDDKEDKKEEKKKTKKKSGSKKAKSKKDSSGKSESKKKKPNKKEKSDSKKKSGGKEEKKKTKKKKPAQRTKSNKITREAAVMATIVKMKSGTTEKIAEAANKLYVKEGGVDNVKQTALLVTRCIRFLVPAGLAEMDGKEVKFKG